ncbi:hypothetical protein D8M34_05930 [Microbacterium sp. HSID17254]|uniref:hypothetical protein n=1 Tax=Microbacterium sp. HSID17254 TaxID=2419509 RepID=UPI000F898D91|nr:hypothetical protein [Microbacterium sp. HSID17254]RUQ07008.1 hypothetical protein D8M34_05930 [Microbacterium sp. HSID17254]
MGVQIARDFDYRDPARPVLDVIRDGARERIAFRSAEDAHAGHAQMLADGAEYIDAHEDGEHWRFAGAPVKCSPAELADIAARYPGRDGRGNVSAFYVYARGLNPRAMGGPHATISDAEKARDEVAKTCMDALDIVCGHVFTSRGTIVRAG